jgi:hypothetical protein
MQIGITFRCESKEDINTVQEMLELVGNGYSVIYPEPIETVEKEAPKAVQESNEQTTIPYEPHFLSMNYMKDTSGEHKKRMLDASFILWREPTLTNAQAAVKSGLGGSSIQIIRVELEAKEIIPVTTIGRGARHLAPVV